MKTKEDIKQLIEKENVEFIRLQFTDMFGTLKNIAVTPGQMERVLDNKFTLDGKKLFGDTDIDGEELYLWPDLDSFVILPWRPQQGKVGKFLCDIRYEDGSKYELSPRTVLENVVEMAEKEGYEFFVDPECEFFLFHTDENDSCFFCRNVYKCPLVQAISKEYVILHYSEIEITKCGLFKR